MATFVLNKSVIKKLKSTNIEPMYNLIMSKKWRSFHFPFSILKLVFNERKFIILAISLSNRTNFQSNYIFSKLNKAKFQYL